MNPNHRAEWTPRRSVAVSTPCCRSQGGAVEGYVLNHRDLYVVKAAFPGLPWLQKLWLVPEQAAFSTPDIGLLVRGSSMGKHPGMILFSFVTEVWRKNHQIQLQSNSEHLWYSGIPFSLSVKFDYSLFLPGPQVLYWQDKGLTLRPGWHHPSAGHWNRPLLSDQVWWASELGGGEGSVKFAAETLKSCQSREHSHRLSTDPDTLLSWKLYLLRECWLTAFLLFLFLF